MQGSNEASLSPHFQTAQQQQQQQQQQQNDGQATDMPLGGHIGQVHQTSGKTAISGGRFDFEDGGSYCGGWEDSKAHGFGVCTGPKNQGAYSGAWNYGFEVSGVYVWPSGSSFEGQWQNGKRHGLGVETRGRWVYRGEWTQGYKGRYGVRQSATSTAKYEGTWANGLQDGYGSETYADGGTYQGQWQRGMRHGYGVRQSAPFGMASRFRPKHRGSMTSLRSNEGGGAAAPTPDPAEKRTHRIDDARGGFVLRARSDDPPPRRNSLVEKTRKGLLSGLKIRKQKSTGELEKKGVSSGSIRSAASSASWISEESSLSGLTNKSVYTDSNASFMVEDETLDAAVTEQYMGEWKSDKRWGYGVSERSDGLKYEGEWYANKKYGYGVTTFRDGTKEEGKYKNNVLITSQKKKHLFMIRSSKFRERIDNAVISAQRASKYALQKADIAISRTATARGKAENADVAADTARADSDVAMANTREYAADFKPALLERFEKIRIRDRFRTNYGAMDDASRPATSMTYDQQQHMQRYTPQSMTSTVQVQQHQANLINNTEYQTQSRRPSLQRQHHLSPQNYPSMMHQQTLQQANNATNNNNYPPSIDHNPTSTQSYSHMNQSQPPGNGAVSGSGYNSGVSSIYATPNKMQSTLPQHQLHQSSLQNQYENYDSTGGVGMEEPTNVRRGSKLVSDSGRPMLGAISQSSIDYFDHYKRPPSRDSSIDRYTRAASRLGGGSRQASVDRNMRAREPSIGVDSAAANAAAAIAANQMDRGMRAGSQLRGTTPVPSNVNGSIPSGFGSRAGTPSFQAAGSPQQPFEDIILRQRTLGQDIVPSINTPKRTESLYLGSIKAPPNAMPMSRGGGGGGGGGGIAGRKNVPINVTLQRKKSLPDVQQLPAATSAMSREEVAFLGSARREEIRRQRDDTDRLRANPLLYLVSPPVRDWFSRQQLVLLVLVINVFLAMMFIRMLT